MPSSSFRKSGHLDAGFSLIELMIALVIAGILVSIALPAFFDSMRKSRRSDAITALSAVTLAQERFRGNNPSYAKNLTNRPTDSVPGLGLSATTGSGYYTISLSGSDGQDNYDNGYIAMASPVTGKSQTDDGSCAYLRVRIVGGNLIYESSSSGSDFAANDSKNCWSK